MQDEVMIFTYPQMWLVNEMIYHDLVWHDHSPDIANRLYPDGWYLSWRECTCRWAESNRKKYLETRGKMDNSNDELEIQRQLGAGIAMSPQQFAEIYVSVKQHWRDKTLDEKIARIKELQEAIRILRVNEQAVYSAYEEEIGELPEELRKKVALKGPKIDQSEKLITDLMAMMQCDRDTALTILKSQGKG